MYLQSQSQSLNHSSSQSQLHSSFSSKASSTSSLKPSIDTCDNNNKKDEINQQDLVENGTAMPKEKLFN